jgi:predicted DsbA family dithiol-disulfide isomerase
MHDTFFQNSNNFSLPVLKRYAQGIGVDDDKFNDCLKSEKYAGMIEKEIPDGTRAGVRGTPSFFVSPSESGGKITGAMVRGVQSLARFKLAIDRALETANSGQSSKRTP